MMLRSIAERLSREVVLKRRLPPEVGGQEIFVSPEGGLKFWRRDLRKADPSLLGMVRELVKPGNTVWDIGANVGLFAFAAAGLAGPKGSVLAVEADTWLVGLLRRSAALQSDSRAPVEIIPAAVSDQMGMAGFLVAARARAANWLESSPPSSQAGNAREKQTVVSVTLDWLLQRRPPPDIVKIDVEGAEALVLRGSQELLSKTRPVVFCEVCHENADAVSECLKKFGYDFYDAELSPQERKKLSRAAYNTVAYPLETHSRERVV